MGSSFLLFSGTSHRALAQEVGEKLGTGLSDVNIETFPDGEIGVQVIENVRGRDVFVLQSVARNPNLYLVELLVLMDAFKRASARSVVPILAYYPYARQDRKGAQRVPITAKLVADLLQAAGATHVLTIDLHAEQLQGFFNIPVDNLHAWKLFAERAKAEQLSECVVVAPDVGSGRLAKKMAREMGCDFAIVDKQRVTPTEIYPGAIVGCVKGKDVILVDDICSTGKTLNVAAKACREAGAKRTVAAVTHMLADPGVLDSSYLDEIWITDSVKQENKGDSRLQTVSIAPSLAGAVKCILDGNSLSTLFS